MIESIEERTLRIGEYIAKTQATVRKAAKQCGVSKSTIHKDMHLRLPKQNPELAEIVAAILLKNRAERHIRGGIATREKYQAKTISQSSNV